LVYGRLGGQRGLASTRNTRTGCCLLHNDGFCAIAMHACAQFEVEHENGGRGADTYFVLSSSGHCRIQILHRHSSGNRDDSRVRCGQVQKKPRVRRGILSTRSSLHMERSGPSAMTENTSRWYPCQRRNHPSWHVLPMCSFTAILGTRLA
jgi:hypothetical protein